MAGGARWAIQTILEHYPKCRVFVCTPIQTGDVIRNERNLEKIAILREICRALSVQLIDCYSNSGIVTQSFTEFNQIEIKRIELCETLCYSVVKTHYYTIMN